MSPGGTLDYDNATLKTLLAFAYNVREFQIVNGPSWVNSEHYHVVAKADRSLSTDEYRVLLKDVLIERCALTVHSETKEQSVYFLRVAKTGPKLQANQGEGLQARGRGGQLFATKVSTALLASLLAARVGRPVLDETGLAGEYDVKLEWDPSIEGTPSGTSAKDSEPQIKPSLFTAIQEQLGLRLDGGKGPAPVLVIDGVHRPSEN
jgi:bla regulator protein blaR1